MARAQSAPPQNGLRTFEEQLFWKVVRKSATIHAGIALLAILASVVFNRPPRVLTPSIRVDLVDLPDFTKKQLAEMKPTDFDSLNQKLSEAEKKSKKTIDDIKNLPVEKPAEPEPDAMALKKKEKGSAKKSLMSAIDRIKALQAIEDQVKKKEKGQQKFVAKGNSISRGNQLTGDTAESVSEYADKMKAKISSNWDLPIWLSRQRLSAQVVIFLDRAGSVSNTVFRKSSGNQQFDEYVLKTIRLSQPFGTPPSDLLDAGITLGFPL